MANVTIGSARIDENGNARGGKAGKQKAIEVSRQSWYLHSKGWRVFRARDANAAKRIAHCMNWACDTKFVGYDQNENTTLFKALEAVNFDLSKLTKAVETDCARLVRVCVWYAGIKARDFYTATEASALLATGEFVELTGAKYTKKQDYLRTGDILVTCTQGHTVVVLSDGSKAEDWGSITPEPTYALGDRILRNGMEGGDIKELQRLLVQLGYSCGPCGFDGEFGDATEIAVRQLQNDAGIEVDGEAGPDTLKAITDMLGSDSPQAYHVTIAGGNCYVRSAPNTSGTKMGVAYNGSVYNYGGVTSEDGWLLIEFEGTNGWVSGKYGRLA